MENRKGQRKLFCYLAVKWRRHLHSSSLIVTQKHLKPAGVLSTSDHVQPFLSIAQRKLWYTKKKKKKKERVCICFYERLYCESGMWSSEEWVPSPWSQSDGAAWGARLTHHQNTRAHTSSTATTEFEGKAHVSARQAGTDKNKRSYLHKRGGVSLIGRGEGNSWGVQYF